MVVIRLLVVLVPAAGVHLQLVQVDVHRRNRVVLLVPHAVDLILKNLQYSLALADCVVRRRNVKHA